MKGIFFFFLMISGVLMKKEKKCFNLKKQDNQFCLNYSDENDDNHIKKEKEVEISFNGEKQKKIILNENILINSFTFHQIDENSIVLLLSGLELFTKKNKLFLFSYKINGNNIELIHSQIIKDKCIDDNSSSHNFHNIQYSIESIPNLIIQCINKENNKVYKSFKISQNRQLQACFTTTPSLISEINKEITIDFSTYLDSTLTGNISNIIVTTGSLSSGGNPISSSTTYTPGTLFQYTCTSEVTDTISFEIDSLSCSVNIQVYQCHANCETCTGPGTDSDNQCDTCPDGKYLSGTNCDNCDQSCTICTGTSINCSSCATNYYLELSTCVSTCTQAGFFGYDGVCIDTCPGTLYKEGNTCVASCSQNYLINKNECVTSCPSPKLKENGICVDSCTSPLLVEQDSCVTSCSLPGYFEYKSKCIDKCPNSSYRENNSCVTKCNDKLSPNNVTMTCDNCQKDGKFKIPGVDECVANRDGYYVDSSNEDTNYLTKCSSNCTTCDKGPSSYSNHCTGCDDSADQNLYLGNCYVKCNDTFYFHKGACVDYCPDGLIGKNRTIGNGYCHNCKDENKYNYQGSCVKNIPPNTYMNDSDYNYLLDCYYTCDGCDQYGDDEVNNCTKCKSTAYQDYQSDNCVEQCGAHLYADEQNKQCLNCADIGLLKLENKEGCVNSIDDIPTNTFKNEDLKDFNYYQYCSEMCATCTGAADFQSNNCIDCALNYYKIEGTNDCTDRCEGYLINNKTLHACVNCKDITDANGVPLVRYEDGEECIVKPERTYIANSNYNVIDECFEKCSSCESGGDIHKNNCTGCVSPYFLSSDNDGNCVSQCDYREVIDKVNRKCINCKKINKMKYPNSEDCFDPIEGVYEVEPNYGIIKNCYESCKTCNGSSEDSENQLCTECKGNIELEGVNCKDRCKLGYYSYQVDVNKKQCYQECPDYTVKNEDERKCQQCNEFYHDGRCVGFKPENTYEIKEINGVKILANCSATCASCEGGGDENDHNCTSCKVGNFKIEKSNCVEVCPSHLATDSINYRCYNCKNEGKFKFPGAKSCLNSIPEGAVLVNTTYNLVVNCYSTCKKCSAGGNSSFHHCDECKEKFFKSAEVEGNCVRSCSKQFFQNNYNYECVNCAKQNKYKYIDQNECLNTLPDNSVVVDSTYNIIETCFERCQECYGPDDTDLIQNCKSCKDGYFLKYNSTNCIPECGEYYYQDSVTKTCINCKKENKYKFKNRNECIDKPDNTIVINNETNIIEECYEACDSCDILGDSLYHNCITCKNGYTPNYYNSSQCEKDCNKRWYFDDKQKYFCTEDLNCVPNRNILVEETSQCVESCYPDSSCILCRTKVLFLDTVAHKCVEECPQGTFKNEKNRECSFIGNDIPCYNYTINTNKTLIDSNLKYFAQQYISTFLDYSQKFVDIIKGQEYILELFYLNECQNEISYKTQLSYIDFKECETFIKNKYGNGSKLVFMKIDMRKLSNNNIPNQIEYIAFDSNGNIIDLSLCSSISNINTTYPIKDKDTLRLETSKQYKEDNIDIFNIEDPFFNDVCFPYYTKDNKDIILRDRREKIYKHVKLCESNCQYEQIDYNNTRVNCNCNLKTTYTLTYTDYTEEQEEEKELKNSRTTNNNILFVKCYNSVFSDLTGNYGSLTLLGSFGLQIIFSIFYFTSSKTRLNSLLYREEQYMGNPPKATGNSQNTFTNPDLSPSNELRKIRKYVSSDQNLEDDVLSSKYSNEKTTPNLRQNYPLSKENIISDVSSKPILYSLLKGNPTNSNLYKELYTQKLRTFDGEVLDTLPYNESIRLDSRKLCEIICQYVKYKTIIISNFFLISPYEPFGFQMVLLLVNVSLVITMSALLFFQGYVSSRYKSNGHHGFVYLVGHELNKCFLVGGICGVLIHIETLFFMTRKRIKCLKYKEKKREEFYQKVQEKLKIFYRNKRICLGICLILMVIFWFYVSSFCAVYPKIYLPLMETALISALFCMLVQILICFVVGCIRYIAKTCYVKWMYRLSQLLI